MKLNSIFFILFTGILLTSCKDKDAEEDFPNNVSVEGKVHVQNEYAQPLYEEREGVDIYVEKAFRNFSNTTDATGRYQFTGLPIGNYVFQFSKEGYGEVWLQNIELSNIAPNYPTNNGLQVIPSVTLKRKAYTTFENIDLQLTETYITTGGDTDTIYGLTVGANILPAPFNNQYKGYRIFIGETEDLSFDNYMYQEHGKTNSNDGSLFLELDNEQLDEIGLESGDSIFVRLYGDFPEDVTYTRPDGSTFYPNLLLETSEIESVVYP